MPSTVALLVAAGRGERLGHAQPKAVVPCAGRPLLAWSLEALHVLIDDRRVAAIGHETLDTDPGVAVAESGFLYGELYVLEQDIYQIEVLDNLAQVPATGAVIVVGPANIKGAPSITSRVYALFQE